MNEYQEDTYGNRIAGIYDDWYTSYEDAMIETLQGLAQGGRALELGIGTGRIALPLQARGVAIDGIDASSAMVDKLRSKAGGDRIQVTLGNFADVAVEGQYALIYVVFNTFFALLTQAEQVRCLTNVAGRLQPGGHFVVEAFIPDLSRYSGQQSLRVVSVGNNEVRVDASKLDPIAQQVTGQQIRLTESGFQLYPVRLRYVWPAELDLMAQVAGMQLEHRWEDWKKSAFGVDSKKHISVYGLIQ